MSIEDPTLGVIEVTVQVALVEVMKKLTGIAKSGVNEHQHYKFRGIDQVMSALHDPLCEQRVLMLPDYEVISEEDRETTNAAGELKYSRFVTVQATYTFVGPAGDALTVRTVGSASDTADKATNKAMAAALKYAVLQTFMVPVGDGDADEKTDEITGPAQNQRSRYGSREPQTLTEPQKAALVKIHDARGLDIDAEVGKRWNKTVDRLLKTEASRYLDELNGKVKPPEPAEAGQPF